jgi:hypothetical protein
MSASASSVNHVITDAEWQSCEALGFVFYAPGVKSPLVDLINTNFTGLELHHFLKEIDTLLKPMSTKKLSKVISFKVTEPCELILQYFRPCWCFHQQGPCFKHLQEPTGLVLYIEVVH